MYVFSFDFLILDVDDFYVSICCLKKLWHDINSSSLIMKHDLIRSVNNDEDDEEQTRTPKKFLRRNLISKFWIYSSASDLYRYWTEKNVTKNSDKSNAKGFRSVLGL